jgi:hypothetical protein
MILFTTTFTKTGKDEELIALLISILFSIGFLAAFALWYEPEPEEEFRCTAISIPSAYDEVPEIQKPPDPNDRFRIRPEDFADVDFANWEYGLYRFGGNTLHLTLANGKYELPWNGAGGETFGVKDVLYADVTSDGKPEAIVILNHNQCGGSCDGGSYLFYVYQSGKSGLRKIWMYETGSTAYGCGLKSFTVTKRQIDLEMFGQCWKPASSFETSGKFLVRDLTHSVFRFNGKRFVKRSTKITAAPLTDPRSYTSELHINE